MMRRRRGLGRDRMRIMHRDSVFAITFKGTGIELRRTDIEHDRRRWCVNPTVPAITLALNISGLGP